MLTHCIIAALTFSACSDDPAGFHIQPYLQWPERDAITVMWETTEKCEGRVRYGPTPEMDLRATENEERSVHELRLTGLLPETRYFYRVESGGIMSESLSFRTAPAAGAERWRLAVYGDSRSFPDRHRQVAELVARFHPDLVVHTGDQVTRGTQRPQWKQQFFDPAANLFSRVPVVTSLGNHEEQAGNYFDYLALPGNEHYFSLDFGNAHIVVLDSNIWGSSARETDQFKWLAEDLARPRTAKWTFVAFHHPLFSAHDRRGINRARWDWCPLFEQGGVDLVLTGHDHFYYRSWPIGSLLADGSRGIRHITTAGGGAPLYKMKERSYTAVRNSVHHCTILDFTDDSISGQVVDVSGNLVDQFEFTKQPTPPAEFCAYEVYELERAIRQELERRPATTIPADATKIVVDESISVPHTFRVPVRAGIDWVDGKVEPQQALATVLRPGEPLRIPVKRQIDLEPPATPDPDAASKPATLPRMKLTFIDDRFRNREIEFSPFKLWRDLKVQSQSVKTRPSPATAAGIQAGPGYPLIRSDAAPSLGRSSVTFLHTDEVLVARCRIWAPEATPTRFETAVIAQDEAALVKKQHVRLLIATGEHNYSFLVSPDATRADACDESWSFEETNWNAFTRRDSSFWVATIVLPRKLLTDTGRLRVNVVHFDPAGEVEDCLSPTLDAGPDPDRVPDFRFNDRSVDRFARIVLD